MNLELTSKEYDALDEVLEDALRDRLNEAIWPELENISVKLAVAKAEAERHD